MPLWVSGPRKSAVAPSNRPVTGGSIAAPLRLVIQYSDHWPDSGSCSRRVIA